VNRASSTEELVHTLEENTESEAIISWYFENIPYSFKQWVKSNLEVRADSEMGLNDEVTVEGTFDGIEFYIKNTKLTKSEKRKKIAGLLR
jgi:hypothetical protein